VAERVTDTTGGYRRSVLRGAVGKLAGRWLAVLAVTATRVATRVARVFSVLAISGWRRGRRPVHPPHHHQRGCAAPQRDLVLVLAAATIVISLIVQGFTLEPRWPASPGSGPAVPGPGH
jgi:hypothetical protein